MINNIIIIYKSYAAHTYNTFHTLFKSTGEPKLSYDRLQHNYYIREFSISVNLQTQY